MMRQAANKEIDPAQGAGRKRGGHFCFMQAIADRLSVLLRCIEP
jgi:hypothetical protein